MAIIAIVHCQLKLPAEKFSKTIATDRIHKVCTILIASFVSVLFVAIKLKFISRYAVPFFSGLLPGKQVTAIVLVWC